MVHLIKITCSCNNYGLNTHPAIPEPGAGMVGARGPELDAGSAGATRVLQVSIFTLAQERVVLWERVHT